MAGGFNKLYKQTFTGVSTTTVTHNQNQFGLGIMVTSESIARPDLIDYIGFTPGNERNEFTITFTGTSTGEVMIIDSDFLWTNTPSPEVIQALSGSYMEASTGDIIWGTPGSTTKIPGSLEITGSGAISGSFSGSYEGNGNQLTNVPLTWQWSMARNKTNQSSVDLRRENGLVGSNVPFITPVSCSLIYTTAATQNNNTWIPEVYKNGVLADSFSITSNTKGSNTSSVTFVPLDEIYMRCNDAGTSNVDRPAITCFFREIT